MFQISVETMFSASHRLEGYNGPCSNLHGHNWGVVASWCTDTQDKLGMTYDLRELKIALRQALSGLEHSNLKVVQKPTAENIAKLIFTRLKSAVGGSDLASVMVEETPGCKVIYFEPKQKI